MVGFGSPDVDVHGYFSQYVCPLGIGDDSLAITHRGVMHHNFRLTICSAWKYKSGDILGFLLDLVIGDFTFFINRQAVNDPM